MAQDLQPNSQSHWAVLTPADGCLQGLALRQSAPWEEQGCDKALNKQQDFFPCSHQSLLALLRGVHEPRRELLSPVPACLCKGGGFRHVGCKQLELQTAVVQHSRVMDVLSGWDVSFWGVF